MTFVAGILAALGLLIVVLKINLRRCLAFDWLLDLVGTALLAALFYGTYSGMVAAAVGGITLSIMLWGLKRIVGYERPRLVRRRWRLGCEWQPVPGRW